MGQKDPTDRHHVFETKVGKSKPRAGHRGNKRRVGCRVNVSTDRIQQKCRPQLKTVQHFVSVQPASMTMVDGESAHHIDPTALGEL